jgi:GNAT superfamily N-acetyltransferase
MKPPHPPHTIRRVSATDDATLKSLAGLTIACVAGGASIGFMHPLSTERALAFWRGVADDAQAGRRALLLAEDPEGLLGTVQLVLAQPDNQPHRADLAKLQVHPRARRRGVAEALMHAAEATAAAEGKTLLVLDTVTGSDADRLYTRLGWQRVGEVPGFALWPTGGECPTSFFYKRVASAPVPASEGGAAAG